MSFQLFKKPMPKERKTLFKELSFSEKISYIFEYGYELQQDTKAKMYGEVSDNE